LLAALAIASTLWAGKEFPALPGQAVVPNQLLVRYKTGTPTASVTSSLAPAPGSQALLLATGLPDVYLVQLPPGTNPSFSTQLSQHPSVEYVEPNRIRHITVQTPNDQYIPPSMFTGLGQWALTNIQALQAWQMMPNVYLTSSTAGALRIKVAVIDSGADCTHPDFINTGGSSTDAAMGGQLMFSPSHAYVTTTVASPMCTWQDDHGHGTHVSGTVAAATNNAIGVASLGYPLQLIEYKVLDHTGSGTDMDVANAITAAADAGASVISMSLGAAGYSQTIQDAITHAWQKNTVVVAAAGNSNNNALFFPAGANYTAGVAATDHNDVKASFSNFGPSVDIAAPGVTILSTETTYSTPLGGNSYGVLDGTSMATPHVAALAGLIDMATPNLASMAVVQRIQQSADGVDGTVANGGWGQNMGYGRMNAYRAISVGNLRSATVGGFVGQVVDSSGTPVASATVMVVGQTSVTTDGGASADGLFRIPNLAAGMTYTLNTTAAGFSPVTMKAAVVAGADTTVTIVMGVTTGEFHGIVSDAGVPIPGAVVQALSAGLVKAAAVTDSTGAYSLLVAPGTFDLQASLIYGVTTTVTSKSVGANGSVAVNISMAKMGSISGTVSDSIGSPVANATITVTATGFSAGAITDVNGAYHTIGISAGTYSVSATAAGSATGATINGLVVTNDHVTTANFTVNSVVVTTNTAGLTVTVDNITYTAPQSFYFAPGSTHTIGVTTPQNGAPGTRSAWSSWSDGGAVSHTISGPYAATYTATFSPQYLLTLAASPSGGGTLAANPTSSDGYYAAGTSVQVTATSNPNGFYQFSNFSGDLSGATNPQSLVMSAPRSVAASFNVQTMVTTNPSGLAFTVDGQPFTTPQTFFWAQGSSHTVAVTTPQNGAVGTHYAWLNWSDAGAISHSVITAGTPTTYTANFTTQYLLTLAASPGAGGTLSALPTSPDGYYASGTSVQVTATANAGYQFVNFSGDLTGTANPQSVVMSAPRSVSGNFNVAATVTTSPAGLSIVVDGTTLVAPQTFSWMPGSSHSINVASPQNGPAGTHYAWSSWSDGGAISHNVIAAASAPYTANFSTQYLLTLAASPGAGGSVGANPSSSDGYYASGTSVQVTGTNNAGYQFANFSGDLTGSANPQSVVMSAPRSVTANFNVQTTIATNPSGLAITVDGQPFTAPQTFNWAQGSTHPVSVSSLLNGPVGTHYVWANWSDGGAISHSVTATATTYTSTFNTQYLLTLTAAPSGGGTLAASPTSPDGYYNTGGSVQLTATPSAGFQFANFSGDLTGSTNPQAVVMSAPRSVTATFNVQTTVTTNPSGLSINVDGQPFTAPQTFNWAQGSGHTIAILSPQNGATGMRSAWSNWSDGGAISHTITASSSTTYTANFTTHYLLNLTVSPGGAGSLAANPSSADGYYSNGTSVQLTATANSGYQFGSFSGDLTGTSNPQSVVISAPRSVTASFNPLTGVVVSTNPPGLGFTVDGASFTSAQNFSWIAGSMHTVAVSSPQNGTAGTRYAWTNWSDGGAVSHTIMAPSSPTTYTANFTTQYSLTLSASPGSGGTVAANPSSADGFYNSGTSVQLTATANSGYQFGSFSGALTGASNPQSVVMSAPRSVAGNFTALSGAVVSTNPPGLSFTVDGVAYTGTHNFSWALGSVHTLAVNSPQNGTAGTRYAWANWSDGGAISHTVTVTNATVLYTANFTTQYLLALSASPSGGGSLTANPPSGDGYYANGTSVQVTAAATAGFTFTGFSGDLTGSTNPQSIAMTAPRSATGSFSGFSTLTVDHSKLNFGTANGIVTSPQTVRVNIAAGVSWSASSNQPNISVSPSSGIGSGAFQVTASAGPGGVVTVSSPGASGSPQIQVNVTSVIPGAPFGSFDTPTNNLTGVAGAIAVTGWALDSVEVTKVDIWREPIAGEATGSNGLVYIGDVVFVADARPDVEGLNPAAPLNYRAGWGYLLLTNFLPNNNGGAGGPGNGPYYLHAIAHNKSGTILDLGTRTINVDNAHATKPFGTIDTPGQGGTASGSAYINFGWALTQNPNVIPFDGSTITVYLDSVPVGHPTYNQFRSDIASLFPGHANSNGAVGFFYIDTTKLANGVHTISWTVFDNVGHGDGIGSRFFNVQNNGGGAGAEPEDSLDAEAAEQTPVEIDQLGRVELQVGAVSGRLLVAGEQRRLPIGSTLKDGVFYWQPPAGFLGEYQLVFERGDGSATRVRVKVGDVGTVYSTTNSRSRE